MGPLDGSGHFGFFATPLVYWIGFFTVVTQEYQSIVSNTTDAINDVSMANAQCTLVLRPIFWSILIN